MAADTTGAQTVKGVALGSMSQGGTGAAAGLAPDLLHGESTSTQTRTEAEAAAGGRSLFRPPARPCTARQTADGHTARSEAVADLSAQMLRMMAMHPSTGYAAPQPFVPPLVGSFALQHLLLQAQHSSDADCQTFACQHYLFEVYLKRLERCTRMQGFARSLGSVHLFRGLAAMRSAKQSISCLLTAFFSLYTTSVEPAFTSCRLQYSQKNHK